MVREGKRAQNTVGEWQKKREKQIFFFLKKHEKKGISVLGEELAVSYTRWLSVFGYVAVKVGLKFTQNIWFYSNNIIWGVVNLLVMHNSVWGEGQGRMHAVLWMPLFTHARVCAALLMRTFLQVFYVWQGEGESASAEGSDKGRSKRALPREFSIYTVVRVSLLCLDSHYLHIVCVCPSLPPLFTDHSWADHWLHLSGA